MKPFRKAMAKKFPDQEVTFASWHRPRDIRELSDRLVSMYLLPSCTVKPSPTCAHSSAATDIAKQHPYATELNVLVIGMPNVGKSTLLNALRNMGIKGSKQHGLFYK